MEASVTPAAISINGARVHNLKNISVAIPVGEWTVITGVSGAGKSSLALETLHEESQRRYIETLSPTARLFLHQRERPDVDRIDNLPLSVAIRQKSPPASRYRLVAEATEILDYLAVLACQVGEMYCPHCQLPIRVDTPQSLLQEVAHWPAGTRFQIAIPAITAADSQESWADQQKHWEENGFHRFWKLTEQPAEIQALPFLKQVTALVIIDRLVAGQATSERLFESLEQAFAIGNQHCLLLKEVAGAQTAEQAGQPKLRDERQREWTLIPCSMERRCQQCQQAAPELTPELFRRFTAQGACRSCQGHGQSQGQRQGQRAGGFTETSGCCPACAGSGLNDYALQVRYSLFAQFALETEAQNTEVQIASRFSLQFLLGQKVRELQQLLEQVAHRQVAADSRLQEILEELKLRLSTLVDLGLGYLTLQRAMSSLSQGEAGRLRLMTVLCQQLTNTLVILDEPGQSLSAQDCETLIPLLKNLLSNGNTLLMVEHQPELIAQADQLIELGPGAGQSGGEVLFTGTVSELLQQQTPTAGWLSGRETLPPLLQRPVTAETNFLTLTGAGGHHLKQLTVTFPLQHFTVITGVSGSGKTSLLAQVLYPAVVQKLGADLKKSAGLESPPQGIWQAVQGTEFLDQVMLVDESGLSLTLRSTPVTYLKVFDEIRKLFAETVDAKTRGYSPTRFSFNSPQGGRCTRCAGTGQIELELHFLANMHSVCPECHGSRFNAETLEVKFRNRNIDDVLKMTAEEAFQFFRNQPAVQRKLQTLRDVGLGYLPLGYPLPQLSSGECQRLKLAAYLTAATGKHVLYLFDEPTAGLHPADVVTLVKCLRRLVEQGHTVIVIDHHPLMRQAADWQIELGPGAAEQGGELMFSGPPAEVSSSKIL